jgi:RNase adaptor protein for sRNA GlmZ degradation
VYFGREIEDRMVLTLPEPEFSGLQQLFVAEALVGSEHRRIAVSKGLGDALAHHANAVDRVDQRLRW